MMMKTVRSKLHVIFLDKLLNLSFIWKFIFQSYQDESEDFGFKSGKWNMEVETEWFDS